MNKMKQMYILWGMLVIGLFILLLIFGFSYKGKVAKYKELEEKIVEAEMRYVDENFLYPNQGDVLKTNASLLIEKGYLDSLDIEQENCSGYAEVKKDKTVFSYKAYIKCNNYKTKGYSEGIV